MDTPQNAIRPPIVAVLGHVDHGKTSLLDRIRKSNIQSREAGGITQSIGASVVSVEKGTNKEITFIDTPGHAAFFGMRSRGAGACDIAVLVVAADDGVKPQTSEALKFINQAGIPYLVVFSKIDLPSADLEAAQKSLEDIGVLFEGRGGNVPGVAVSARTGEGIDELLQTIYLLYETTVKKDDDRDGLEAVVIETSKGKAGHTVSVVIKKGLLSVGDEIFAEGERTRIRGLFDSQSKAVKKITGGYPAQIIGFTKLPPVGSLLTKNSTDKQTASILEEDKTTKDYKPKLDKDELPIVLKASSAGSLEAIKSSLPAKAVIVGDGIGDVTENDVLMAKSSSALVFSFQVKTPVSVVKLAKTEGVEIHEFEIIYKLLEKIEELLKAGEREILGRAEIVAEFPFNDQKIAGCRLQEGIVSKNDKIILVRGDREIGTGKIVSVKKNKQETSQVKAGEECGILIEPKLDFKPGDVLVSVRN